MAEDEEKELEHRASSRARLLRDRATSMPPDSDDRDVREGVAASAEIGILVLQKTNALTTKVAVLSTQLGEMSRRVQQLEDPEKRATELLFKERRSQLELQEEVTRADLNLRKLRTEHRQKIVTRIIAAIMTPPGLWGIWEWLQRLAS